MLTHGLIKDVEKKEDTIVENIVNKNIKELDIKIKIKKDMKRKKIAHINKIKS